MPVTTPFVKIEATRAHGADVVLEGETLAEAQARAETIVRERDLTLVHPYDDALVIAGQGTIALEMLAEAPDLDILVIPVGGGGLIAGNAVAARARAPAIEIIGAEAALYPSSWNALQGESRPCGGATLAEGIAVKNVGALTLPIVKELVSEIVLVDEVHLERAVNAYLTLQKTMAEGAGAAGLAAMLAKPEALPRGLQGRHLILCGGNIDPRILASVMVRELKRESRIVSFRLSIPDRPGVLGQIATRLGEARHQYSRGRPPPALSRCPGQGRQARHHHRDARSRPRRDRPAGARRRRLRAGANRDGDRPRVMRRDLTRAWNHFRFGSAIDMIGRARQDQRQEQALREKELRIALVCSGGVSLAVYMHGMTKEILKLVRASSALHRITDRSARAQAAFLDGATPAGPEYDYTEVGLFPICCAPSDARSSCGWWWMSSPGASAGGISGTMLARARSA